MIDHRKPRRHGHVWAPRSECFSRPTVQTGKNCCLGSNSSEPTAHLPPGKNTRVIAVKFEEWVILVEEWAIKVEERAFWSYNEISGFFELDFCRLASRHGGGR